MAQTTRSTSRHQEAAAHRAYLPTDLLVWHPERRVAGLKALRPCPGRREMSVVQE
ncbi:hypothetical protein AB0F13_10340 [Streptomyces sp. NPDC026206]|uniref:hypothetical protein n=1 Tax=Streptomyces sp. NPDC026206 TaxID=3157089 RepID=UPI0033C362D5